MVLSSNMDEEGYREAVRQLRVGGWSYAEPQDLRAIESAADTRKDIATLVLIDFMMERDDVFSRRLGPVVEHRALDELLDGLLRIGPCDELWHILFRIVERDPTLLSRVEDGIADWPDSDRRMPEAWWQRILAGERQEYFRLARNSGLQGELLDPERIRQHAPCFHWLTELALDRSTLDVQTLKQFMALPDVRRLRRLSLVRTGLREAHAALLARGEKLAVLEWLDLSANEIGPTGAASLIGHGGLASLEFLNLTSCNLSFGALACALSGIPARQRPVALNLTHATLDRAGFPAFVECEAFSGVGGLELYFCKLQPSDAEALAQSPTATALRRFQVNDACLGEAGVKAVLSSCWIAQAEQLNFFNQGAGDGIAPYLKSISGGPIEVLELLHNKLGPETGEALGGIELKNLRQLRLSYNELGDEGAAAIFRNKSLTSLEHVEMQGVGAGPATARAIAENTNLRSLRFLRLGDNLGVAGARLLAEAPHLSSLAVAHLGGVPVSEQAKLRGACYFRNARVTVYP